jgi:two-component system sensor kinase FixL
MSEETYIGSLKDLIASEHLLKSVINYMADGLVGINERGLIHIFNPACERMFGYAAEEVIGKNVSMLMPMPHRAEHDSYLSNYKERGTSGIVGTVREFQAVRKNGEIFPIEIAITELAAMDSRTYTAVIRDITDRKGADKLREKLIESLMQANVQLEQFAYVASHDLREPLRMVVSFTDLLMKEYGDSLDDTGRSYMQISRDAAKRMEALVTDLLEYARLGREPELARVIDCNERFKDAVGMLQNTITTSEAVVTSDSLPHISAHPVQFNRLLQNLIANAIHYHRPGVTPHVHVSASDLGDAWEFCVEDNGLGIQEEYLEYVFQPFKRLHSHQDHKGTGIGLAICRKIVENFGGVMRVESTFGKGSRFYFTVYKT